MSNTNESPEQKQQPAEASEEKDKTATAEPAPVLQEASLSWAGKIFFAGVAAYLTGIGLQRAGSKQPPPKLPFKIRGTPEQIKAVIEALVASKSFQQELKKPGATVESVIDKLNLRNMTKERFRQVTGKPWPI